MSPFGPATFWAPLPGLVLLLGVAPGNWNLSINAGMKLGPAETGRCCAASNLFATSLSRSFADRRVSVWGEVYARLDVPHVELGELAGDAGTIVNITRRVAVDLGLLVGRARRTLVIAVLAGLSVRFGG
ncbi:hypothetical protein [Nannocystis pusilla]|uniref:Uncharacterized protein n=1 Tax=Nannocystis pusilla TaxID=889268 RepID=A0ABS7TYM5_9BACT|nr:hypothetical protein [Nannocystis pusilla]MBZ5713377.1 hypothetical protein [Nannocystis pusilla]